MRRYGTSNNSVVVKGNSAGFTATLSKIQEPIVIEPVCEFNPKGLYWYSEESANYDSQAEAGLLENYSDNVAVTPDFVLTKPQYHWTAKLLGELCDYKIDFVVNWSGDFPPHYDYSDNGEIFVFPRDDNKDEAGVMTIVARVLDGNAVIYTSNEIYLVITSASYYYTISQGTTINALGGWLRLTDNFDYSSYSGQVQWYGGLDGSIGVSASNNAYFSFQNMSGITKIFVYSNDGGSGTYRINNGGSRYPERGAFFPPWDGGTAIDITGLSSLELNPDGYGSPWYIFVR